MSPLAPAVSLAAVSLLLYLRRGQLSPRVAYALSLAGLAVALLLGPGLGARGPGELSWRWDPSIGPEQQPVWRSDPVSLSFILVLGFVALAALGSRPTTHESSPWADLLLLAATTIFLTAANELALVLAWFLLDAGLFLSAATRLGMGPALRLASVNFLGGTAWLLATALSSQFGERSIAMAGLSGIALWVRGGLYPAQTWGELGEALPLWRRVLWGSVNLAAAGYLWSRAAGSASGLAWLSLLISLRHLLTFWRAPSTTQFVQIQISLGAALAWAGGASPQQVALYFVSLILAAAILHLGEELAISGTRPAQSLAAALPDAIAVASVIGVPPTLGFAARWLLYRDLLDMSPLTLLAASLIFLLSLPPLAQALRKRASLGLATYKTSSWIWLGALALLIATLSLVPSALILGGFPAGELWHSALAGEAQGFAVWALLLLPGVAAGILYLRWPRLATSMQSWQDSMAFRFDEARLRWLGVAIARGVGEALEAVAWLGRGRHGAVWLTLYALGIALAVFLM